MSTKTIHSYFDQQMIIDQNDVVMHLHDPWDSENSMPTLKCDLGQFLDGITFMFQGKLTAEEFIQGFTRKPIHKFCNGCSDYKQMSDDSQSYCSAFKCVKIVVND